MRTFRSTRGCLSILYGFQPARIFCLCILLLSHSAFAQTFPPGFSQVQVASGISNPTVMAFAPDGRIFVAEQGGRLRVIKNGSLLSVPFVQVSVNSSGERGLIGIALDPHFTTNPYIYLYYTVPNGTLHNRISRFMANGDVALAGSETVILELDPLSSATNHNGGAMHFGKDGKLYVAVGENANPSKAQSLDAYHGKILRINSDGSAPTDNPYSSGTEQKKRVWSYGLRNPYTFSVQPGTGRIFVNDVGQVTWEEINEATAANRNFGWPNAEGVNSNTAYTNPVYAYRHGTGDGKGCAITGGTFFNPASTNYPASYAGKYFFQDFCNKWINVIDFSGGTVVRSSFATNLPGDALSLETGHDGNLFYLSRSNRALYKIIYTTNTTPAITSHPSSLSVSQGQAATFRVSATGTGPLNYQWQKNSVNIAGATGATYAIASTVSTDAGAYRVVVTNATGSATSNAANLTITASNAAPTAKILTPAAGITYMAGTTIQFSGSATDAEDGTLPADAFNWTVDFYHDTHVHDGPPVAQGTKSGSFTIPNQGETSADVWYRLILDITDSQGRTNSVYRDIYPRTTTLGFATSPAGLNVTLDGQPQTTPSSVLSVEGIVRSLGVVSPQTANGVTYEFVSWSQGGSATQAIATPANDVTYTATFRTVSQASQAVSSFTLLNADTDRPIAGYDPLLAGATLDLSDLPTQNLNIRANTTPATVGSVRFAYDGNNNYRSENGAPYCIGGNQGNDDYLPWTPSAGNHTLTATPYTQSGAGGVAGTALTINFSVTDNSSLRNPENPASTVAGIDYTYYEGQWNILPDFAALTAKETGNVSTFSLAPRNRNDNFGFRYTGYLNVPTDGEYTFYTSSDDGSQLYIGSQLIVDNDGLHASLERSDVIGLKAGLHAITVTFFEKSGSDILTVSYAGPAISKQTIPASALFRDGSTMAGSAGRLSNEDTRFDDAVSVYPNPVSDYVTVNVQPESEQEIRVVVVDVLSRNVAATNGLVRVGAHTLPVYVGNVEAGVYFVIVHRGNQRTIKRIVIAR